MTFFTNWEDFAKSAERLFATHPNRCRIVTKYVPGVSEKGGKSEPKVMVRFTDDFVCLQYVTDQQQDMRKLDKLNSNLMRAMVSKDK